MKKTDLFIHIRKSLIVFRLLADIWKNGCDGVDIKKFPP